MLAASYVYGIDDNNNIYQVEPNAKTEQKIFSTGLSGTANSNAFAYDRTTASREFLFYMHANPNSAANQTLYVWNKLTGVQSTVASAAQLGLSDAAVGTQPGDAAFYNDRYWFFEQGNAKLHEVVLDYTGGTPVFASMTVHDIDFSGIAGFDPAADNIFGDIAINGSTGILYASTTTGYLYSLDTSNLGQPAALIGRTQVASTNVGLQLSFNTDYTTLYGQRFIAGNGSGVWYSVSTTDASLTDLNWTSPVGFRDLGGASPVAAPALAITKTDGATTVFAGDGVPHSYTITVTNNGLVPATDVVVTDSNWPTGFVQGTVTAPVGTTFTPGAGGNFTWTFTDPLAAGASQTLTVPYTVPFGVAAGERTNTASVTSPDDPESHDATDSTRVVSNALVAGNDLGCLSTPRVYVINPYSTSTEVFSTWLAYEPSFRGGVRVAIGDVDDDGFLDVVTGPGPGRPGQVKVFNLDGTPKAGFTQPYVPFGAGYRDGVEIGLGDINGDGKDDLVASKSRGRGDVQVATSDGTKFTPYRSFTAFSAPYTGGATAAISGENRVVVGSGAGMKPTIKTYNVAPAVPTVISQFQPAFQPGTAGVSVTAQRFVSTGNPLDVLAAAGRNGNSKVSAYQAGTNANLQNYSTFSAPAPKYNTPVYAAGAALAESVVVDTVFMAQGDGGTGTIKKVNATTGAVNPAFVPLFNGKPLVSPLRIATNTRPPSVI